LIGHPYNFLSTYIANHNFLEGGCAGKENPSIERIGENLYFLCFQIIGTSFEQNANENIFINNSDCFDKKASPIFVLFFQIFCGLAI